MRSVLRTSGVPVDGDGRSVGFSTARKLPWWLLLGGLLLAGLVFRLVLIGAEGFHGDVSSFEAWSLTLAQHPMRDFYAQAGFADYPPGYFFILWCIGHAYTAFVHDDPSYAILKIAVKLPAIVMDIVNTGLVFALVRRFATRPWAFAAAALVAFNPAAIFISAYWGQVDSVAAGLTLGSLLLMIDANGRFGRRQTVTIVAAAWLLLAYSVLIKPPAIVIAPLYLAFAFATDDAEQRFKRLVATLYGLLASCALAYVAALGFHPGLNPFAQYAWLIGRYAYAVGVYPYNSINAFNLYELSPGSRFWESDATVLPGWHLWGIVLGLPQYLWGIVILAAAVLLIVPRFGQRRDPVALLEGALILSLGYFVLSTRMHERYLFNGMMLAIPLIFYRRRYLLAAVILTCTLLANLFYSLDYLHVVDQHVAGVDPTNLSPWLSHTAASLNVALFFFLGYAFLGTGGDIVQELDLTAFVARLRSHRWFWPLEGVAWMAARDWAIGTGLAVASFVLSFIGYTWPPEKIFDEIYYARAGEEYLSHKDIFEFTHPPLTKLLITLSMILFGGTHGAGDTAAGWRFLNVVVGALMVLVLYCFAKRLLGSTLFATIAAGMLLFDGFHYVQSRIATPEITVAFFSLLTLYAFYRFWIASQVRVTAAFSKTTLPAQAASFGLGLVLATAFSLWIARGQNGLTHAVAFLYAACGAYVAIRVCVPKLLRAPRVTSYAEGSRIDAGTLATFDGGRVPLGGGALIAGESTAIEGDALVYLDDDLRIEYLRSGKAVYATAAGEARFAPAGTMNAGGTTIDGGRDGALWLWLLAIVAGALAASKWNGLFDFFVVWVLAFAVVGQRYWTRALRGIGLSRTVERPPAWGNPLGFSLDVVIATMLFVGATIYTLTYIPYFLMAGHNLQTLVGLQQQMFGYHYDLTATHPYGSKWWQWPFIGRPIAYYYHDWRAGAETQNALACCVSEILALPNPLVWWSGLISVPLIAWLAFSERQKGYLLLVTAYLLQWLPWILSPRVTFEYHFFPNLAIICLANAAVLQRIWRLGEKSEDRWSWPKCAVFVYCGAVVLVFCFFLPILAGVRIPWYVWDARMLPWLMGNNWV